jgi:hypothetical protein
MGQMEEWISGNVSLDEGYWDALLRDGENGRAAPVANWASTWDGEGADVSGAPVDVTDQWKDARETMERGDVLELPVIGCNRGGVLIGWKDLRGFVPASAIHRVAASHRGPVASQDH